MSGHTPGPHIFEPHNLYGSNDPNDEPWPFGYLSTNERGTPRPIFELRPIFVMSGEEMKANAELYAAASELLAALEAIVRFCDDPSGSENPESLSRMLPAARAALAKVTGGTP